MVLINGVIGFVGKVVYNLVKYGFIGLIKVVVFEVVDFGIIVNVLCFGYVDILFVRG